MGVEVLDMQAPDFEQKFVTACREIGAALIVNHQIDPALIQSAYNEWLPETGGFFGLSEEQKLQHYWHHKSKQCDDPEVGFYPMGSEAGSEHHKANKGSKNENEYYHIKPGLPHSYPDVNGFEQTKKLASENENVVLHLLDILDRHGPDKHQAPFFGNLTQSLSPEKWSTFRWLHYPPYEGPGDPEEEIQLIKVHKDKGCLTTVVSPSTSGLCVEDRHGVYHRVPQQPGAIIAQIAEGLELMSGNYYYAGRHTVMGKRKNLNKHRVSAARFWHFKPDVRVASDVTNGDMMENYWRKKGLQVDDNSNGNANDSADENKG